MADSVAPAIVTGVFGVITTVLLSFKSEILATIRPTKVDVPYDDLFRPLSSVDELLPASKEEARRTRPFDTKVNIQTVLDGKAIRFELPADHSGFVGIVRPLFLSGWLMGWTLGVFATATWCLAWLKQGPVPDSVTNVHGAHVAFVLGALLTIGVFLASLAGEVGALVALKRMMFRSFGRVSIVLLPGRLVLRKNLFGLSTHNQYDVHLIDGFDSDKNLLFLRYGVKRIPTVDLTDNELEWLKPEVQKALTFMKAQSPPVPPTPGTVAPPSSAASAPP